MNKKIRDHEYDDYPIPVYDPSLSPEDRAAIEKAADEKIAEALRTIESLE